MDKGLFLYAFSKNAFTDGIKFTSVKLRPSLHILLPYQFLSVDCAWHQRLLSLVQAGSSTRELSSKIQTQLDSCDTVFYA